MNDLENKLKELKKIEPDRDYSRRSFYAIVSGRREAHDFLFASPLLRLGVLAAVITLIVIAGVRNDVPLKLAGLDPQGLTAEAEELELQLKLAEVSYKAEKQEATKTALKEAAENQPGHLNTLILKKELDGLDANEYVNPAIDDALNALSE